MHGLLNIDKPAGVSSRHVVSQLERVVAPLAAGHAGTLDPLATGVLVVCVGRATKLVDCLHRYSKTYVATFLLGRSSDTEDITGEIQLLADPREPTREELERALPQFLGKIQQQPPAFSALRVAGKRAYKLARKGQAVELQPRPIVVQRFEVLRYEYPELQVEIECGTGTYVRSLGRDLARAVGSEALMSQLRRTRIGPFDISSAIAPEQVRGDNLESLLQPSILAAGNLAQVSLTPAQVELLSSSGVVFDLPLFAGDFPAAAELAALAPDGRLFAILTPSKGDRWKVKTMLG
jgi:tRNA pseudouridine55 synthase